MESEKEFRKQLWALRNPNKPLPDSDEAKEIKERNKWLEQYTADRKQFMREKKQEAVMQWLCQMEREKKQKKNKRRIIFRCCFLNK